MNTATYPTATFRLTEPILVDAVPQDGVEGTVKARDSLTLHGVAKSVTVKLTGRRDGSTIQLTGSIPIAWVGWNIPNPSFGPVTTEDHGELEFLLVMKHE